MPSPTVKELRIPAIRHRKGYRHGNDNHCSRIALHFTSVSFTVRESMDANRLSQCPLSLTVKDGTFPAYAFIMNQNHPMTPTKQTKSPHTPGPYSVSGITGDYHITAQVGNNRRTVAIIPGWPSMTPAEHGANIALFRQAPSLLAQRDELRAALIEVLAMATELLPLAKDGCGWGTIALDNARAALNSSKD